MQVWLEYSCETEENSLYGEISKFNKQKPLKEQILPSCRKSKPYTPNDDVEFAEFDAVIICIDNRATKAVKRLVQKILEEIGRGKPILMYILVDENDKDETKLARKSFARSIEKQAEGHLFYYGTESKLKLEINNILNWLSSRGIRPKSSRGSINPSLTQANIRNNSIANALLSLNFKDQVHKYGENFGKPLQVCLIYGSSSFECLKWVRHKVLREICSKNLERRIYPPITPEASAEKTILDSIVSELSGFFGVNSLSSLTPVGRILEEIIDRIRNGGHLVITFFGNRFMITKHEALALFHESIILPLNQRMGSAREAKEIAFNAKVTFFFLHNDLQPGAFAKFAEAEGWEHYISLPPVSSLILDEIGDWITDNAEMIAYYSENNSSGIDGLRELVSCAQIEGKDPIDTMEELVSFCNSSMQNLLGYLNQKHHGFVQN